MAKQTCTPINTFGPHDQTLFLGCSVQSFTASLGWNEQPSQLTVTLVEDPCAGSKVWYNPAAAQPQRSYNDADPGFYCFGDYNNEPPPVGAPVYFRMGNFEYAGLIQDWTKSEDTSQGNKYVVSISDPRTTLEGAQCIINDYVGAVQNVYNVFNTYGYIASYLQGSSACPIAEVLPNGIQWNKLKIAIGALTSNITPFNTTSYSPYGRIVFKGSNESASKYGLLPYDNMTPYGIGNLHNVYGTHFYKYVNGYFVDLAEVPVMPDDYRIPGNSVSILDAVSQVCHDAGYDYYVEMILVQQAGIINKFIKFRTVNRRVQPYLNAISNFIDANSGSVMRKTRGREVRNELTNTMVIGGNKKIILEDGVYTRSAGSNLQPFWGFASNNKALVTSYSGSEWKFEADTTIIDSALEDLTFGGNSVTITEGELRAALAGQSAWMDWQWNNVGDILTELKFEGGVVQAIKKAYVTRDISALILAIWGSGNIGLLRDFIRFAPNRAAAAKRDLKKVFQWVKHFATDFYGKKYMIKQAGVCFGQDAGAAYKANREVTDAGYPSVLQLTGSDGGAVDTDGIIGLDADGPAILFFELDDGRIVHFVRFDDVGGVDPARLDPDSYILVNVLGTNYLYVKVQVDPNYVIDANDNINIVITLPGFISNLVLNPVPAWLQAQQGLAIAAGAAANKVKLASAVSSSVEHKTAQMGLDEYAAIPNAAAISFLDNQNTYGPWYTDTMGTAGVSPGPPGKSSVEKDDGLVPWEFGGYANMNAAGNAIAESRTSLMQMGETGELVVPGYPEIPLGAELGSVHNITAGDPGAGSSPINGSTHLVENRSTTSWTDSDYGDLNSWYVTYGSWEGAYGPNITNINVQVGENGISTSYQMRTFTPSFGRLSKLYIERIRSQGQQQRLLSKQFRFREFFKHFGAKINSPEWLDNVHRTSDELNDFGSPHILLAGRYTNWEIDNESCKRTEIASLSAKEGIALMDEDKDRFDNAGICSLDVLFRPVSVDGDGDLPPLLHVDNVKETTVGQTYHPPGAQPPFCKFTEDPDPTIHGFTQYDVEIVDYHLNPLTHPTDITPLTTSIYTEDRGDGTKRYAGVGHDMEILGRTTLSDGEWDDGETKSLVMHASDTSNLSSYGSDYAEDYRLLAMRGPMVMQGWGYDTDGKPIPNQADDEADCEDGEFKHEDLEDSFLDNFLHKPNTWPVGPIDLRWDRGRGCWVSPPEYRLVIAELNEDCGYNSAADAFLIDPGNESELWDEAGNPINYGVSWYNSPRIQVYNKVGGTVTSGTKVLAYYDPQANKYYIVESPPEDTEGLIKFELTTDMTSVGGTATARKVRCNNNLYEYAGAQTFTVAAGPGNGKLPVEYIWGPAQIGWHGWALREDTCTQYDIVYMERFAQYIQFSEIDKNGSKQELIYDVANDFWYINLEADKFGDTIVKSWFGNDPTTGTSAIRIRIPDWMDPACVPDSWSGIAIFVAQDSSPTIPVYRVVSSNADILHMGNRDCEHGKDTWYDGEPIPNEKQLSQVQTLIAGTGIHFRLALDGEDNVTCTGELNLDLHFKSSDYDVQENIRSDVGNDINEILAFSTKQRFDKIDFGKGLIVANENPGTDADECTLRVGLNLDIAKSDTCWAGVNFPEKTSMEANSIELGQGLRLFDVDGFANDGIGEAGIAIELLGYDEAGDAVAVGDDPGAYVLQAGSNVTLSYGAANDGCRSLEIAASTSSLVKFQLTQDMTYEDNSATANKVECNTDGDWIDTGVGITVVAGPGDGAGGNELLPVEKMWGPAQIGWHGWATLDDSNSCTYYEIVYMERFAQYIRFSNTSTSSVAEDSDYDYIDIAAASYAQVNESWFGNDPKSGTTAIRLILPNWMTPSCMPSTLAGIAVFVAAESTAARPAYRIISSNADLLQIKTKDCYTQGDLRTVQTLVAGTGLSFRMAKDKAGNQNLTTHACTGELNLDFQFKSSSFDVIDRIRVDTSHELTTWSNTPQFSRLEFGEGLTAIHETDGGEKCTLKVGLDLDITAFDACWDDSKATSAIRTNSLLVAQGLRLFDADSLNDGYGTAVIGLAIDGYNSVGQNVVSNAWALEAGNNITFTEDTVSLCKTLKIDASSSAGMLMSESDCHTTDGSPGNDWCTTYANATGLVVGLGLDLNMMGGKQKGWINLDLGWNNNSVDNCTSSHTDIESRTILEDIMIGDGLKIKQDQSDECTGHLFLNMYVGSTEQCWGELSYPTDGAVTDASRLIFGKGLKVKQVAEEDTCDAEVYLAITADGQDDVASLTPGCAIAFNEGDDDCELEIAGDFTVVGTASHNPVGQITFASDNDCHQFTTSEVGSDCKTVTVKIGGKGAMSTYVDVVTDCTCNPDGSLTMTTTRLNFDACGHFINAT